MLITVSPLITTVVARICKRGHPLPGCYKQASNQWVVYNHPIDLIDEYITKLNRRTINRQGGGASTSTRKLKLTDLLPALQSRYQYNTSVTMFPPRLNRSFHTYFPVINLCGSALHQPTTVAATGEKEWHPCAIVVDMVSTGTLAIFTLSGAEVFGDTLSARNRLPDCHFFARWHY